jgi:predicted GNAT family acetyltransferase
MATLRWHGTTAQIEGVYTLADARGRGHARTVVTHALRVAQEHGHTVIFLVADADGTVRQLYERLGFDAIGRRLEVWR